MSTPTQRRALSADDWITAMVAAESDQQASDYLACLPTAMREAIADQVYVDTHGMGKRAAVVAIVAEVRA
jgi:hypothetical protein